MERSVSRISIPADLGEEELRQLALADERVQALTADKNVDRVIVVPRRLANVVVSEREEL